jgi:hypothetical protein
VTQTAIALTELSLKLVFRKRVELVKSENDPRKLRRRIDRVNIVQMWILKFLFYASKTRYDQAGYRPRIHKPRILSFEDGHLASTTGVDTEVRR